MLPLRTLRIRHIFLALANVARLTDAFMRLKRPRPELQQRPLRHAWSIWRASLKTILAALAVRELAKEGKRLVRGQAMQRRGKRYFTRITISGLNLDAFLTLSESVGFTLHGHISKRVHRK